VLWALASYGPTGRMDEAERKVRSEMKQAKDIEQRVTSARLENSFVGLMGKGIEPIISPLGYDWKLGISLITSFAAREVFVGSLATIYAAQSDESNTPLIERLKKEKRADGTPVYTLASGLSLMVFYVYAMQCMATLAVVKRETRSWKWPIVQIAIMGLLAYVGAFIIYQIFR
ncbi:MAG: ferrous iron transporter B, partial [Cryomorphaceae bacterium]|nr:ferrous iron transporter B [Cryomorphaceae bacterium]